MLDAGYVMLTYHYLKRNNKFMKYYDLKKNDTYWDVNNLYEWAVAQK